jgi:hypothetical protein
MAASSDIERLDARQPHAAWTSLGGGAKAFRVAHAAWSAVSLASLGYVWRCALVRRQDALLAGAVAFLSLEGVALAVGRGDCPMAGFQRRLGDPVPLFELILPPRAAKAAIPVLFLVTVGGFAAVVVRRPAPDGRRNRPGGSGRIRSRACRCACGGSMKACSSLTPCRPTRISSVREWMRSKGEPPPRSSRLSTRSSRGTTHRPSAWSCRASS